jgi:hypothetical protein
MLDCFMQVSSLLTKFSLKGLCELPVLTLVVLLFINLMLILAEMVTKFFRTDTGLAIHGRGFASPSQEVSLAVHSGAFQQMQRWLRLERTWIDKRATYAAHPLLWSRLGALKPAAYLITWRMRRRWTNNDAKP